MRNAPISNLLQGSAIHLDELFERRVIHTLLDRNKPDVIAARFPITQGYHGMKEGLFVHSGYSPSDLYH
jgi:hypothetical protein